MKTIICSNQDELISVVARMWCRWNQEAVAGQHAFNVALAGGSTPKGLYQFMARQPCHSAVDWSHQKLFFGDERSVPPDHRDSNYRMVKEALLDPAGIPGEQVFPMPADSPDIDAAARGYEKVIAENVPAESGLPRFDLVLLGMGDDGHTASLFPGTTALAEQERLVVPVYVERLQTWRMTLTYPLLNNSRRVVIMVCGENKAGRIGEIFHPDTEAVYPIQGIQPQGELYWCLDMAAARHLQN